MPIIVSAQALQELDGLSNLSSVGDRLVIANNALANLSSIPAAIIVWDNDKLTELDGLGGIVEEERRSRRAGY